MTHNLAKKIEEKLKAGERPEPPAELLQRLKDDIPAHLGAGEAGDEPAGGTVHRGPWLRGPRLRLMAASLFVVVIGGVVAYRVVERAPQPGEFGLTGPATELDEAPAATAPAPAREGDDVAVGEQSAAGMPEAPGAEARVEAAKEAVRDDAARQPLSAGAEDGAGRAGDRAARPGDSQVPAPAAEESDRAAQPPLPPAARQDRLMERLVRVRPPAEPEASGEESLVVTSEAPLLRDSNQNLQVEPPSGVDRRLRREQARLEAELKQLSEVPKPTRVVPMPDPTPESVPSKRRKVVAPWLDSEAVAGQASTGGTDEPNDQPYGDMFYRSAGVNPFIDTEDDRLSTFGLDVDTGSYTLARSYLERGHLPPPEAIRVEEFVNYFDYGDAAPRGGREDRRRRAAKAIAADVAERDEAGPARRAKQGDDFAIVAEGAPSPFGEGERYALVRFGLKGREIDVSERRPAVLTFVVDVSGSMGREDRLGLVRRTLELLLDELRSDDRVGLVVYGRHGRVVLEPTGDKQAVRRAIGELVPAGATNAEEGLVLGYEMARKYFRKGAINRVILCSDGVANVGRTGTESILERIAREADDGIELTTVGFGMGNYNDVLMEQLADRGDGRYAYVDDLEEARRVFVENLTGTLQTIASDAKVQVEFDPRTVSRYRLLGYENRDVADERFRDDTVDAGEIGAGHAVTALYEIKLHESARSRDRLATLHLRYRSAASGEVEEVARELALGDLAPSWEAASPALKLGSLVAEFAEILRRSYWAREGDLDDVFRRAQRVSGEFAGDAEVADLVSLIGRSARLWERRSTDGPD